MSDVSGNFNAEDVQYGEYGSDDGPTHSPSKEVSTSGPRQGGNDQNVEDRTIATRKLYDAEQHGDTGDDRDHRAQPELERAVTSTAAD